MYSVCLVTVGLLRWSDTFTTVLAVWVTLVTMASLPVTVRCVVPSVQSDKPARLQNNKTHL